MKTSFIKKIVGCSVLTLLFSLSLGVGFASADIPNSCDGDGIIDTAELCDNDRFNAAPVPIFNAGVAGNSTACADWGYLSDAVNVVVCDPINCDIDTSVCLGSRTAIEGGWGDETAPDNVPTDIKAAIMNVTNWILGFVAIIATLVVIYGGVLYLTAAGNEDNVATAKKTIAYGIIGIVVTGLAYAMVIVVSTVILSR
ncbi:MAG: hypothetical protein KAQ64_02935 [Candidatus Pacebacteria bacterium]|nr:hypothetical protein [Candidatus Paceibacterota bacterium]